MHWLMVGAWIEKQIIRWFHVNTDLTECTNTNAEGCSVTRRYCLTGPLWWLWLTKIVLFDSWLLFYIPFRSCCQSFYVILSKPVPSGGMQPVHMDLSKGQQLPSSLCSVTSHWELAVSHTRDIYTMETLKKHKRGFPCASQAQHRCGQKHK